MKLDTRSVKRVRTEKERRRRRLYGDEGAKFSARHYAVGGEIMSSLTTVADKDNIIFELIWI